MSKVSIIVPVYNVEQYLPKCLDSLVNQTFKDIEIIIVNDGSPDNSQKIIDRYLKKYPKIIKVLKQENQGLSDARNNGLKLATSDYIVFVDSDDYIELDMIEKMYNKILEDKSDIVFCGNNVVDENYNLISTNSFDVSSNKNNIQKIIFGNMCAWNKLIKKDVIIKNKLKFRSRVWYEDLDYSFKLMVSTNKTSFLNEKLYNYLVRKDSIMNSKNIERNKELLATFDEILSFSKKKQIYQKYISEIEFLAINHIYISGIYRIINSNAEKAIKYDIINMFIKFMDCNFKKFKNNKYIKDLTFNRKIIYKLINLRQYWLIRIIYKLK